jgi:bifunctional non-homologous end joining protein LigD
MLAQIKEQPFDSSDWIFEPKYDGYRALALCNGNGDVKLYSRNLLSFNDKYPPVVTALQKIPHACLLDGEVVVEDKNGKSDFQLLQNYLSLGQGNLKYYVFDLLQLDDNDVTELPLLKRKELLKLLLSKVKLHNIFYSEHVVKNGIKFCQSAIRKGWEGIMAKSADSTYHINKRSGDWLKIKIVKQQEAVITGFTSPKGSRSYFGSILLGAFKNKELKYIGHCGTGFGEKTLKTLYGKFKPLFSAKSPFKEKVVPNSAVQWLKPKLVCEIKFTEWTTDENMRHPVYLGLREDKNWKEVKIEKAEYEKSKKPKRKGL